MATRREIIDPRGDVVLKLRREIKSALSDAEPQHHTTERKQELSSAVDDVNHGSMMDVVETAEPSVATAQGAEIVPETVWETVEIVVASKILCLISPVFEALLTGPFRESREFAHTSRRNHENASDAALQLGSTGGSTICGPTAAAEANVDTLYSLELPEDDPEVMIVFMRVAHYRPCLDFPKEDSNGQATVPGTLLLEQLAVLADKYQCMMVLDAISTDWAQVSLTNLRMTFLEPYLAESQSVQSKQRLAAYISNCCRLLVFCAATDVPAIFSGICSDIVNHHKGPITSLMANYLDTPTKAFEKLKHPLLPEALPAFLETMRRESLGWLQQSLFEPVISAKKSGRVSTCKIEHIDAAIYLRKIKATKLVPLEERYSCESLYGYFELAKATLKKVPMDDYSQKKCSCSGFKKAVKAAAESILKEHLNHIFCLDCIRSNGRSKKEDSCTVKHSAYPCYGGF